VATQTITVYLLKETVGAASDALKAEAAGSVVEHALSAGRTTGTVFVERTPEREPSWVRMLGAVTQPPVNDRTRTSSALLVMPAAGRWFAVAFGQGRYLLKPEIYVRRFGLRVALNAADPAQLRGARARSFNDTALQTQRQVSRLSSVEALELDVERDLLTAMSGAVADPSLGIRIDGRDSVRLTAELDASKLRGTCTALLKESKRRLYKQRYPWIDNVEEITDPAATEGFEEEVAATLARHAFSDFDLFPPELVSEEIVQFRTQPAHGGLVVVEPDSSLLRYPIPAATTVAGARDALRRYKLIGVGADGDELDRWSFWDCLHHEFNEAGRRSCSTTAAGTAWREASWSRSSGSSGH
jgi:uncharacterized protein (TIGR04141 family)